MNRLHIALGLILLLFYSGMILPFSGLINQGVEYYRASQACTFANQIRSANTDKAIGNCRAGEGADVIELTEDITLTELLPSILSDITILGNGHTISGDGLYQIFEVTGGGKLTLKDAHLTKGFGTERPAPLIEDAGAIEISNGSATIINSMITESTSEFGGAISVAGRFKADPSNNLTIINSAIANNSSFYAAIAVDGGTARIIDSTFSDNSGAASGGAISNAGRLTISGSRFLGNSAHNGGAIANWGELTVISSEFSDNTAHKGGAIYSTSKFSRQGPTRDAAEIYDRDYGIRIRETTISQNSAEYGGGLYVDGWSMSFAHGTLMDNEAGRGGGMYSENADISISESLMENNRARQGSDIYRASGTLKLNDRLIAGNSGNPDIYVRESAAQYE